MHATTGHDCSSRMAEEAAQPGGRTADRVRSKGAPGGGGGVRAKRQQQQPWKKEWWWLDSEDIFEPSAKWLRLVERGKMLGFTDAELEPYEMLIANGNPEYKKPFHRQGDDEDVDWVERHEYALNLKTRAGKSDGSVTMRVIPNILVPVVKTVYSSNGNGGEALVPDMDMWTRMYLDRLNAQNVDKWKTLYRNTHKLFDLFLDREGDKK